MIDWELFAIVSSLIYLVTVIIIFALLFNAFKKIDNNRTECMKLRARLNRNPFESPAMVKRIRSSEPPSKKISFDLEQIGIEPDKEI